MKIVICWALAVALFQGCGSSSTRDDSNTKSRDEMSIEELVNSIDNKDFQAPEKVPYRADTDNFSGKMSGWDVLARESIARVPQSQLQAGQDSDGPISKAIALCYQKKFNEGFKVLSGLYAQYKSHPSYWTQVGTCHFLAGNNRKALLYYNKALDINPDYAPPINNLGVLYQRDGKDQRAIEAFKKAAQMNAFSLTPIFNLAQLYLKYGFVDEAQKIFASLRQYNSRDVDVTNGLANCYFFNGELDKAISLFGTFDSGDLAKPYIGINYALALRLKGRNQDANTIFSAVDVTRVGDLKNYYNRVGEFIRKN